MADHADDIYSTHPSGLLCAAQTGSAMVRLLLVPGSSATTNA